MATTMRNLRAADDEAWDNRRMGQAAALVRAARAARRDPRAIRRRLAVDGARPWLLRAARRRNASSPSPPPPPAVASGGRQPAMPLPRGPCRPRRPGWPSERVVANSDDDDDAADAIYWGAVTPLLKGGA